MNLDALRADIAAFHQAAFALPFPTLTDRKKAMQLASRACPDDNIRNILGGSIGFMATRPELVRAAIAKAYSAVETLRENRASKG